MIRKNILIQNQTSKGKLYKKIIAIKNKKEIFDKVLKGFC
jgi:hypothetical protein